MQYVEIPITKKMLTQLARSLYVATISEQPILDGDKISIDIHGWKEIALRFKVVPDKYSIQELRDLLNKDKDSKIK